MKQNYLKLLKFYKACCLSLMLFLTLSVQSQVLLEKEVKITDFGLHFNGSKVDGSATNTGDSAPYDYYFGKNISAHGDCIKTYEHYVFMTWYKGGKAERNVMLTRYNTLTGSTVTIEFPHRHTGFQNRYWIGESHNTIAVAVSPLDGTIHLLYDMHAYSRTKPSDGSLSDDYFRYSYSIKDAAALPDADFTLDKFVKNANGGYKHLSLNEGEDYSNFAALTYPQFFLNDSGDIFMYMREGGNNNGAYKFSKYDASTSTWSNFTHFNVLNAKNQGTTHNWGLYGNMKYVNGKIRIGFQRRLGNNNDKYKYQNGVYYAYSDNQNGANGWKNHEGQSFSLPLIDADEIKVMEPGDYVTTTMKDKVYIVGSFDWTVTENGDVHIISKVRDLENNVTKYLHTYKPAGASNFITSEDFTGASSIYTAGGNVYIIGLNSNGRVFVEKTPGGTNSFERIYDASSGKSFDHGRVHIADGKLYYYLMEGGSGNALPLHLQIIDLGISTEPFRVSLTSPINNETYNVNESIELSADAINENGSIAKVDFLINGSIFNTDTTAPYKINWIPTMEGNYTIQALAYDAGNNTVASPVITVKAEIYDPTDITQEVYRMKNVETGKYIKSVGAVLEESDFVDGDKALDWTFVTANYNGTTYLNIDSEVRGILRGAGAGVNYSIVNTTKSAPNSDVDKVWNVHYNEMDKTYRFEARNNGRYLYVETDGNFYNLPAEADDERSKFILELASDPPLSVSKELMEQTKVRVFPNPTNNNFSILFSGLGESTVLIYDILGKPIYKNTSVYKSLKIENKGVFKPGVYLIKVIDSRKQIHHKKLVIK